MSGSWSQMGRGMLGASNAVAGRLGWRKQEGSGEDDVWYDIGGVGRGQIG